MVTIGPNGQYVYGGGSTGTKGANPNLPINPRPDPGSRMVSIGGAKPIQVPIPRALPPEPAGTYGMTQPIPLPAGPQTAGAPGKGMGLAGPATAAAPAGRSLAIPDPATQFQNSLTQQQRALNVTNGGSNQYYQNLNAIQNGQAGYRLTPTGVQSTGYRETDFYARTRPTPLSQPGQNLTGGQYGYGGGSGGGFGGGGGSGGYGGYGGYGGGFGGLGGGAAHGATSFGGGVGGIGGAGGVGDLANRLQSDFDKANAATEARYQQALSTSKAGAEQQRGDLQSAYGGIQGQIAGNKTSEQAFLDSVLGKQQGLIGNLGSFQKEQNHRLLAQEKGSQMQSLVGRGLGNSTVVDSLMKGLDTEGAFRDMAVDDANARLGLGALSQYGSEGINALGRNDAAGVNASSALAGLQNNVTGNSTGQQIALMEAKSDLPPNIGQYLGLLQQAGALGAGGYGGYGGAGGGFGGGGAQHGPNRDPFGGGGGGGNGRGSSPLEDYLNFLTGNQQGQNGGGYGNVNDASYWGPGGGGSGGSYPDPIVTGPAGAANVGGILGTYNPQTGWAGGGSGGMPYGTGSGYDENGNPISTAPGYSPPGGGGGAFDQLFPNSPYAGGGNDPYANGFPPMQGGGSQFRGPDGEYYTQDSNGHLYRFDRNAGYVFVR